MKLSNLSMVLSFNGGYVDTLGFLALSGLFTAHVTGNFVTLGATVAVGMGNALPKLLAIPVFCGMVFLSHLLSRKLEHSGLSPIRPMLAMQLIFLGLAAIYMLHHGPIVAGEDHVVLVVGLTLVAGMAIQNGLHRAYLSKFPPTTLMTGSTTQVMIDLANLFMSTSAEERASSRMRMRTMGSAVVIFAIGCALGAAGYIYAPAAAFVLPALLTSYGLLAVKPGA